MVHMVHDLLICSITAESEHLVCACTHCGWLSGPVDTGTEAGRRWDEHMASSHAVSASA